MALFPRTRNTFKVFGEEENINKIKDLVEAKLTEKESTKGDLYSCHIFGSHRRRNEEYAGPSSSDI